MGVCCSFAKAGQSPTAKEYEVRSPDFGLSAAFDVIKFLGKGAEGEAWLAKVRVAHPQTHPLVPYMAATMPCMCWGTL